MAIPKLTSLADFSTGIGTAGAVLQVVIADGRVGMKLRSASRSSRHCHYDGW